MWSPKRFAKRRHEYLQIGMRFEHVGSKRLIARKKNIHSRKNCDRRSDISRLLRRTLRPLASIAAVPGSAVDAAAMKLHKLSCVARLPTHAAATWSVLKQR